MSAPPEAGTTDGLSGGPHVARTNPPGAPAGPGRGRRRLFIILGIVAMVAALVTALLTVAPRYVARYVADKYLKGMEINVDGVKTIDIDLWNGEFSLGPVQFHAGSSDPGTIGLLGVKLSLSNLMQRQALLQSVVLQDVDVAIRQAPDGEIVINGISLRQILAEEAKDDAEPKPPADAEKGGGWDAGIDDLTVRNTKVSFTNRAGGTAAVTVDRLDLRGFRTWEPDQPGTFVLTGDVNDAKVTLYGNARPFGEKINVFAEFTVDGVDLSAIDELTGPLPVKPTAGTATVYARNTVDITPDGRIDGSTAGTLVLSNLDVADPEMGSVKLDQAATEIDVQFALDADGAMKAAGKVLAKLNEGKAALADGTAVGLPFLTLDLTDLAVSRTAAGAMDAATGARLQADRPQLGGPADVRAEQVLFTAPRIEAQLAADGATGVRLQPAADGNTRTRLEVTSPNVAAPVRATGAKLALDLDAVALDLKPDGTGTASATAGLAFEGGSVGLPGAGGRETVSVDLATLTATLAELTATLATDGITAAGKAAAGIDGFAATLAGAGDGAAQKIAADTLRLTLEPLSAKTQGSRSTLATNANLQLAGLSASLPQAGDQPPAHFDSRDAELGFRDLQLETDGADGARLAGSLNAALRGLAGSWGATSPAPAVAAAPARPAPRTGRARARARQAPPPPPSDAGGRFAAESLTLGATPLTLNARGEEITGRLSATTELSKLDARVPVAPGEPAFDIALARLRIGLSDGTVSSRGADAGLAGRVETTLDGLNAVQPTPGGSAERQGERLATALQSLRLTLSPLDVKTRGDRLTISATGGTEMRAFRQELPKTGQKPAVEANLGALRANLSQITADVTPGAVRWETRLDAQAERLDARGGGGGATLKLATFSIGDIRATSQQRVSIERLVLDRLQAFATRDYIQGSAAAPESRPKEVARAVEEAKEEGWKVRIGSLGVTGDSAIRLRDTSVQPNANFTIAIQTLQVQNVDMTDPAQRTQVRMDLSINEFTELALAGWAAPFQGQPDFDLNARLRRLELPPLSPYAAPAIGVNVESGRLSVDTTVAATSGKLAGDLEVTLRDLNFSTLSAEDAKRLSAAVGVPIETVVGLLQDDEGRIRLKLPISGDLANPSFDPSDAIRQALTGALQAAVLAPFQLAFAPVALIAKAAGGGPMTFQPVPFQPGEADLDSEGTDIAAGLARVLAEREKLKIKVCGQSTMADLAAIADDRVPPPGPQRDALIEELRPKLQALASERTAAARRALINDGGAKTRQVGECRSTFDPADEKPPRADVGL